MKYIYLVLFLLLCSCSFSGTWNEKADDTVAPTLEIPEVNRGGGESFSSF